MKSIQSQTHSFYMIQAFTVKTYVHTKTCTWLITAALFKNATKMSFSR